MSSCKKKVAVSTNPPPVIGEETKKPEESTNQPGIKDPPSSSLLEAIPVYEIIRKTDQERKDSGLTLYVLIQPIDTSNKNFISHIKNLIKKIVKEGKQNNITIEVFDSMNALDWMVSKKSSTAPLLQVNHIAKFVGESKDEPYSYTLYFFPNATKDNATVNRFIDIIDFDPSH